MKTLSHQFVEYIAKVAGLPAVWGTAVSRSLPQYLNQQYDLREIIIGKRCFWGILIKDTTSFRPAAFVKHLRQLIPSDIEFDGYCLIAEGLPGYTRRRLVERQIPFVVPDQQMFWPTLGLAIQARRGKNELISVDVVSPATQAVLVFALTGGISNPVTPKALATRLNYTTMTMSRAFDEIESSQIGTVERKGRERLLSPESVKHLWEKTLPYMRNPVRETVRIAEHGLPQNMRVAAGETALAQQSMLSSPREPIYALGRKNWKKIAADIEEIPVEDEGTCLVQLWRYDPALLASAECVDPFSLYLSLIDETDERVKIALEEMLEKFLWL